MERFTRLMGVAAPLDLMNVDTDMIIPKQFLRTIKRSGLGQFLFDEMRRDIKGQEKPEFILNKPEWQQAKILVSGANFGCGSSREHAPWALLDFGIKCVIAPSFADIFYNNCFKNGMLPITLPEEDVVVLLKDAANPETYELLIDLENCRVTRTNGRSFPFVVDEFRRHCLLNGLDDIGLTLQKEQKIAAFEAAQQQQAPWLWQMAEI
ncbi:MAG: 3-isopropylmalate dehydratase small subunit [Alphaproteobacteria bacterium]